MDRKSNGEEGKMTLAFLIPVTISTSLRCNLPQVCVSLEICCTETVVSFLHQTSPVFVRIIRVGSVLLPVWRRSISIPIPCWHWSSVCFRRTVLSLRRAWIPERRWSVSTSWWGEIAGRTISARWAWFTTWRPTIPWKPLRTRVPWSRWAGWRRTSVKAWWRSSRSWWRTEASHSRFTWIITKSKVSWIWRTKIPWSEVSMYSTATVFP